MEKKCELIWKWSNEQCDKICSIWEVEKDLYKKHFLNGKLETLNELRDLLLKVGYSNEN